MTDELARPGGRPARVWGAAAAALWAALVFRWFDVVEPAARRAADPIAAVLAAFFLVALTAWVRARWATLQTGVPAGTGRMVLLSVALAIAFRLPLAWHGAAGYVTADGALSGIVALDAREGRAHHVFVPEVPYSGSLKSHLTAGLAAVVDPARAFALVSLAFYAAFVAALVALVSLAEPGPFVPAAAGLYAAFAPPFVTRYSLSNDGNYVEVLALGTAGLVLAARWAMGREGERTVALAAGVLLGAAFWCHILAVIPLAAVALFMLVTDPRRALRAAPALAFGFALGDAPGLLWNACHGGDSFRYLIPGAVLPSADGALSPGPLFRLRGLALHLLVLFGYDFGYGGAVDLAVRLVALVALGAAGVGAVLASLRAWRGSVGWRALVLFAITNLAVATSALPYVPGNPRYLLFLFAPGAAFLALALRGRLRRVLLAGLVMAGAAESLAQGAATIASDREWRAFVAALRGAGVRWCETDFFLATKVNFLSEGAVVCSAKLGPTTTEYFFRFRREVEGAPEAALIAVNATAADKLERRLERLGVSYERRDLMKPVLLRLSRKTGASELFPDRDFPLR